MTEIKAGDWIVLTDEVPESILYPWVKPGAQGVVSTIHPYDYSVLFPGEYIVDPTGHPCKVGDPVLIFLPEEIKLKEDA